MIIVKLRDKRHYQNTRLVFFNSENITLEIYTFVKKHKNVSIITGDNLLYSDREKFLTDYKSLGEK